jgi:hypothetical protein
MKLRHRKGRAVRGPVLLSVVAAWLPMTLLSDPKEPLSCSAALEQVLTLKTSQPVYRLTASGERDFLEDADRPAELARLQRIVAASCSTDPKERAAQEAEAQRLHLALSPECTVARDQLNAMEARNSHEPRDSVAAQRKLVVEKCPAVSTHGRWLLQWNGRSQLLPDSD